MRMSVFHCSHVPLLVVMACLWSFSCSGLLAAMSRTAQGHTMDKDQLDPNVRDWGDYSDLSGIELGLGLDHDEEQEKSRGVEEPSSSLAPELDFLSEFAGKKRLWVITAPSHSDHYLRMMEKQLEDTEQVGLNCRLAERDTFIVTIIQNAMMEGRIQKTTFQGDAIVESLDPDTVSKLLHYLELTNQVTSRLLEEQAFSMVILKKNLRVSEHFPYPVRLEAVLEVIDQFPMRKLEKMTRKGSHLKCKLPKKKVVVKRKKIKKKVLSSQRHGNHTTVPLPRPMSDKKAALKSKIQDILNGRSRFVIRKKPTTGSLGEKDSKRTSDTAKKKKTVSVLDGKAKGSEEVKTNRYAKNKEKSVQEKVKEEPSTKDDSQVKSSSKKKGKGKKGKKGKGRGKKSNSEISEKDRTALKDFVERLKGKRRLMVISTPNSEAPLYTQQKEESKKRHCEYAVRKITVATIMGSGHSAALTLQHFQLDSEPPFKDLPDTYSDPGLISLLRAELGLSSPDLFSMTVTDYDIQSSRVHEAPLLSFALFDLIDHFPSRGPEKEKEEYASACSEDQPQSSTHNSLLRFMSKRRLLLISTPSEDDYSFQQQLSALSGQECPMGIRHFALLKLVGSGAIAMGTVELFPLNGRSQSEVEPLSGDVVNNLRGQLKISKDYFSMVVVEKDGDVKAWFPSPMWTLDNIYDLVDSTELRHQEESLQRSLGIHCPEDRGGAGQGRGYHGYEGENTDESYLYHRAED